MKYLIAVSIIFIHATSFAKWQFIGTVPSDRGDREEYYDDVPIGKGNFPRLWILRDYKNGYRDSGGDVYFSEKNLYEFSCKDREIRTLSMNQYSDNFGGGNIIYSTAQNFQGKWTVIVPGATASDWYKIVCK